MSWCAGFSGSFWSAYHDVIPRAPGGASHSICASFLTWCSAHDCQSAWFVMLVHTCARLDNILLLAANSRLAHAAGFEERAKLYRFYHLCNHYVLFGGGYKGSAMAELSSLTHNMK